MTTDPFTEAARAEAERRHVPLDRSTAVTERCAVQGFRDGAEWARTHLAAQEPTDAEQAVRDLHHERKWRPLDGTFIGGTVCNACRRPYPCPTISVLDRDHAARRDEEKR